MRKVYEKSELRFALIWIGIYVVLMNAADSVSETIGAAKIVTAPICAGLVLAMYLWIRRNGLKEKYGLCPFQGSAKQYLFFIPLVLLASTNLWWGVRLKYTPAETALYVVSMLCVGFLEEVIFRGFLFKALCRTSVKQAVVISSVTFGIGHIVNLLNGRDIPETIFADLLRRRHRFPVHDPLSQGEEPVAVHSHPRRDQQPERVRKRRRRTGVVRHCGQRVFVPGFPCLCMVYPPRNEKRTGFP